MSIAHLDHNDRRLSVEERFGWKVVARVAFSATLRNGAGAAASMQSCIVMQNRATDAKGAGAN